MSPLSAGTRTLDAVGMVAQPSTNTVRGRNDFEGESVFYGLEVNGHVDDAGEFIVEYIKGIDNEFSRTERDTWMLYLTQWINITIEQMEKALLSQMNITQASFRKEQQSVQIRLSDRSLHRLNIWLEMVLMERLHLLAE